MKKNKYKIKKWVLIPIFLLLCSLVLGFGLVKPANAFNLGYNSSNNNVWYTTLPTSLYATIVEHPNYPTSLNGLSHIYNFPSNFPSNITSTTNRFSVANWNENVNISDLTSGLSGLQFQELKIASFNDISYRYYENLITFNGSSLAMVPARPLELRLVYNDLVLPYGNQIADNSFIRNQQQLELMNSNFFKDALQFYLYKYSGAVVRIDNVNIKFARLPSSNDNPITELEYTWVYDSNNNYYHNLYTGALDTILFENDVYYRLNLNALILNVIQNEFNNSPLLGQDLIYIQEMSINCYTEALTFTNDYIGVVSGSSIQKDTTTFYNDENVPNSSFFIDNLDWFNPNNLVVPYFEPVEPVDMSSWLIKSVGAFMNAELFPGFAIGGIIAVIIAFPLAIWLLKVALGG